ncbi:MAG: VWA domain-containing protein [Opitutus sp.]|nr:VWA domain-containing protein [Opitutus sp.]
MNFLAPLFLLGGLAVALPVIYHLVRRTTRERATFSSLMFLRPTPPRLSQRSRLEHLLLLLLRCLALGLLALGFSRPFFKETPLIDPTGARPKRLVVLVDVSASMRRDGVWPAARERVEAVLRRVAPMDELALLTFDRAATALVPFDEWNRTPAGDRAALASARLAAVTPGWAGTHLGNALITAAEALAETDGKRAAGPRQIVLVSDLQAGSRLDALQAYEWPKGVDLLVEPVKARNVTNAGLQLVADSADSAAAATPTVRVRVSNSADSKREQFKVGWGRPDGSADFAGPPLEVYVPPGQSRVVAVPVPKNSPASDRIVLRGDDEDFDNTVFVLPPAQQKLSVLWLGRDAPDDVRRPLFFLRRALSDTPRLAVAVVARAPTAPLLADEVDAASVIFVAELLPGAPANALRERMLAGKTVVFTPESAAAAPTLAALLGREGVALEEARPGNYAMLAEIDFKHPLFAPFADPRFSDFTKIHIWKYRKLDPASIPDARVVARFDSGAPALVEVPLGKGRLIILTTGWQPEDSQLAVSSKFVPLLYSLIELGGGVGAPPAQWFVGDAVPWPVGATTIRVPGSATPTPWPADTKSFTATAQPGFYELTVAGRAQRFAVNVDANESRTAPLAADELEHLGVPVAPPETDAARPVENKLLLQGSAAENRQKLWRWFIAATLAVLLMESVLAGWTARRLNVKQEEPAS